jgi:hypothetical protein
LAEENERVVLTTLGLPTKRLKHLREYSVAVVERFLFWEGLDLMTVPCLHPWGEKSIGVRAHLYDSGVEGAQAH